MKKKIILLIEKDNKYILIKNKKKGSWTLPNLISEISKCVENVKAKYGCEVTFVRVIEETDKFCFAKFRYNTGKINFESRKELISDIQRNQLVRDKLQKELIEKLALLIEFEALNDALWLGVISKISFEIKEYEKKSALISFIIFFSSVFCGEVLTYRLGDVSGKRNVSASEIKQFRNNNLKNVPVVHSDTMNLIIREMGINFNEYFFDIALYFVDKELIDINSRTWDYNKIENFELINGCLNTPYRWIENQFPTYSEQIWNKAIENSDKIIESINNSNYEYRPYSTYKIYNKNIKDESDKIYIIQRYGLVKTVIYIDKMFKENYKDIENASYSNFIRKIKSIVIEMIWNDSKNSDLEVIKKIFKVNEKEITSDFYTINRKCRDNMHYGDYQSLTDREIMIIDEYQNKYLKNVIKVFDESLTYKFGLKYRIAYLLAKIQYWASH